MAAGDPRGVVEGLLEDLVRVLVVAAAPTPAARDGDRSGRASANATIRSSDANQVVAPSCSELLERGRLQQASDAAAQGPPRPAATACALSRARQKRRDSCAGLRPRPVPLRCRDGRPEAQKEQRPLAPVERSEEPREPVPALDGLESLIVPAKRIERRATPPRVPRSTISIRWASASSIVARDLVVGEAGPRRAHSRAPGARGGRRSPLPPGSPSRI